MSTDTKTTPSAPETDYKKPTHGIFRLIPNTWVPYAELARLDRPAGFWVGYWHYLIGLGFALNTDPFSSNLNFVSVFGLALYLAVWGIVFRGIFCTWNDILDQDLDRQVARCRVRPIPRGAVNTYQALAFAVVLIGVGAAIVYPAGPSTLIHGVVKGVLFFIYPFLKRYTNFPQVELGLGLSYGIFLSASIIGKDPLAPLFDTSLGFEASVAKIIESPSTRSTAYLYAAGAIWCVIFDTIYAHQDYVDDLKAGVRGLAVRLGRRGTKPALSVAAAVQIYCLAMAGQLAGLGKVYFISSCGGAGLLLGWMIWKVKLEDPKSCAWAFGAGSMYVGASVTAGLLAEFGVRKYGF